MDPRLPQDVADCQHSATMAPRLLKLSHCGSHYGLKITQDEAAVTPKVSPRHEATMTARLHEATMAPR